MSLSPEYTVAATDQVAHSPEETVAATDQAAHSPEETVAAAVHADQVLSVLLLLLTSLLTSTSRHLTLAVLIVLLSMSIHIPGERKVDCIKHNTCTQLQFYIG